MAKRRSENGQMRREDYEAEQEGGGAAAEALGGGFERASDASIRQRKIVKARVGGRAPGKPAAAKAAPAAAAPGANPFGGFQGLTASQPAAASANPFAGFSGLTSASASASAAQAVPATPAASSAASSDSKAAPATSSAATYQEAMEALNKEFLAFVNSQARESPSEYLAYARAIGDKHAATKPVPLEQQSKKAAPAPTPFSFAPMANAPRASTLGSPASRPVSSSAPSSATKPKQTPTLSSSPSAAPSFSFGAAKKDSAAATAAVPAFSFAAAKPDGGPAAKAPAKAPAKAKDSEPKPPSAFGGFSFASKPSGEPEKVIPAFSFGSAPVFPPVSSSSSTTPSTAASSGFSLGSFSSSAASPSSKSSPLPPASKPFSFGAPAASSSTPAASGENEDEDEENIGREAATVILKSSTADDDNCTFEVEKAKVLEFKKDEKRWADKGVHPLQVLVNKETKSGRVLIRNEIGKIVLNAALYKGIALKPHETKGKKTGVLLSLQADAATGLTQFILKVNAAKVDALMAALEKAANGASS